MSSRKQQLLSDYLDLVHGIGHVRTSPEIELEKLMTQATTDDQLDRIMANVVERDKTNTMVVELAKILQRREDLRNHIIQRASTEHKPSKQLLRVADLVSKAQDGDPEAQKAFQNLINRGPIKISDETLAAA